MSLEVILQSSVLGKLIAKLRLFLEERSNLGPCERDSKRGRLFDVQFSQVFRSSERRHGGRLETKLL